MIPIRIKQTVDFQIFYSRIQNYDAVNVNRSYFAKYLKTTQNCQAHLCSTAAIKILNDVAKHCASINLDEFEITWENRSIKKHIRDAVFNSYFYTFGLYIT